MVFKRLNFSAQQKNPEWSTRRDIKMMAVAGVERIISYYSSVNPPASFSFAYRLVLTNVFYCLNSRQAAFVTRDKVVQKPI